MIYERVVTLKNPQSLSVHEPKAKRRLDLYSFFVGALTVAIVLGLLGGFAIRAIANEATPPPAEPQKMAGKLEIPSATVLSLLETVEIGQPEQETHAWDVPLTDEELSILLQPPAEVSVCPRGAVHKCSTSIQLPPAAPERWRLSKSWLHPERIQHPNSWD